MKKQILITLALFALAAVFADTVNFTYDTAGRLTGINRNGTNVTSYQYDVSGNITRAATSIITDTDGDGMADSFENTYFGNLSRNGVGDFDNDGFSDLAEYLAGTVPTNSASLLLMDRVLTNTLVQTTVSWSSVSGRTYRLQFKNAVNDAGWNDVPGNVAATGTTAIKTDLTTAGQPERYYRVQVLP